MRISFLPVVLGCLLHESSAARILGIIPFSGRSHYISMQPLFKELALRGHDITMISYFEEKDPPPNYRQIVVKTKTIWELQDGKFDIFSLEKISIEGSLNMIWNGLYSITDETLSTPQVQDFIKNDKSHFDLIITELFYQEAYLMFGHKYNAPVIGLSTLGFTQFIGVNMGSPLVLSHMTHEFLHFEKMNFMEKCTNVYATLYDLIWRHYYLLPKHQAMVEKYFPDLPRPLPQLEDLEKNVSAVFLNSHYSTDMVRPYVPGIIEIGGYHVKEPKELPKDIKKFLDESKDGAIFFSLGTNVQSNAMSPEKLDMFLSVFAKMKQRVLWKWEDDQLKGKPDNVYISKWMPQSDILAHPNMKVFITHGGLLSNQEALHRGVPLVGLPLYGDQHMNMAKVENLGYGLKLTYRDLTKEILENTLNEVITNPKFSANAKMYSARFRDRQNKPLDTAIFWAEYVIRHKGAGFMKSPAKSLSVFELHMMDIAVIVSVILTGLFSIGVLLICAVLYMCKGKKKRVESEKKNK